MGLLDLILRDQLRRRGYGGGYGYGRHRRSGRHAPFPFGRPTHRSGRHRRRGNVHVRFGGCCLPIPLGVFAGFALATRTVLRRRSR